MRNEDIIDLSITIVAYKNYTDIKKIIKCIEDYTSSQISKKIYVVDNTNPKSEEDINIIEDFKNYIKHYEDIIYLDTEDNLGFGKGHNYVIEFINSRYHAIVNPDILFADDVFSSILLYLQNNQDVGMCIPKIVDENGVIQQVYREEVTIFDMFIRMFCRKLFPRRVAKHTLQQNDYSKPFQVPFGQGSFLVIKTELFKKLRGFDDSFFMYLEDADLCKRVNEVSKLMYYPEVSVIHKWEKGSHKSGKLFRYHLNSMRYYFKKWGYKYF